MIKWGTNLVQSYILVYLLFFCGFVEMNLKFAEWSSALKKASFVYLDLILFHPTSTTWFLTLAQAKNQKTEKSPLDVCFEFSFN